MGQLVQIFGSVLILVSFGLAQLQKLSTRSRRYLTLNLAGSAILAADAAAGAQWGFLLLEGAWAIVSLLGLAAAADGRWRGLARRLRPPTRTSPPSRSEPTAHRRQLAPRHDLRPPPEAPHVLR